MSRPLKNYITKESLIWREKREKKGGKNLDRIEIKQYNVYLIVLILINNNKKTNNIMKIKNIK